LDRHLHPSLELLEQATETASSHEFLDDGLGALAFVVYGGMPIAPGVGLEELVQPVRADGIPPIELGEFRQGHLGLGHQSHQQPPSTGPRLWSKPGEQVLAFELSEVVAIRLRLRNDNYFSPMTTTTSPHPEAP